MSLRFTQIGLCSIEGVPINHIRLSQSIIRLDLPTRHLLILTHLFRTVHIRQLKHRFLPTHRMSRSHPKIIIPPPRERPRPMRHKGPSRVDRLPPTLQTTARLSLLALTVAQNERTCILFRTHRRSCLHLARHIDRFTFWVHHRLIFVDSRLFADRP